MYPQPQMPRAARLFVLVIGLLALTPGATVAQARSDAGSTVQVGALVVSGAWARATPPAARTGAVYLTVTNEGTEPDRLVAGASPAAASVELHVHTMEGSVARMRAVDAVEVSPGEPAVFQPGGLHVMLIDLRAPLRDGQSIQVTLTFARAGTATLNVPVRRTAPAGAAPSGPHHQH